MLSVNMRLRQIQQDIKQFSENLRPWHEIVDEALMLIKSPQLRKTLNSALDVFKPHFISMGARISRLSPSQVEIVLPEQSKNSDSRGETLDGVVISVGLHAFRMLMKLNAPEGDFNLKMTDVHWRPHGALKGELRLRGELNDLARENLLLELREFKRSKQHLSLLVVCADDQIRGELEIHADIFIVESLDWK
jgi:hypothetical protein